MNRSAAIVFAITGVCGAIGVMAGAFGAHALERVVSVERLSTFQTGVHYHLIHTVALLGLSVWMHVHPGRLLRLVAWFWVIGIVLFSGSLYGLVLFDVPILGAVTPFGGVAFIVGWILVAIAGIRFLALRTKSDAV